MQACHQDKMRFNIRDGKSSVVRPSSLLPGLKSKCGKRKGGPPSVVTHLNAKDSFLPSSLSFCTLISFASPIPPTFFHSTVSLYSGAALSSSTTHVLSCFAAPLSLSQTAAFHPPSGSPMHFPRQSENRNYLLLSAA